jgi:oxygen-dependent protoporphyrinogen oxidase
MKKIAVVGAGISGITAARLLEQQGHEVTLFEALDRPGGRIFTEDFGGDVLEWGPHTLLSNHESFEALISLAGLQDKLKIAAPEANKRYVWKNNRACELPDSLLGALSSPLLGVWACLRLLMEPFVAEGEAGESVHSFFKRRLGRKVADHLVDPFVSGIYSGDSRLLSAEQAFPRVVGMVKEHGSLLKAMLRKGQKRKGTELVSFEGGMCTLIEALMRDLKQPLQIQKKLLDYQSDEEGLTLSFQGNHEERFDQLILALMPDSLSKILREKAGSLSSALIQQPSPALAVVHLRGEFDVAEKYKGFGLLFGAADPLEEALGVLHVSDFFPRPDGQKHYCVYLGGRRFSDVENWSEGQAEQKALTVLRKAIKLKGDPEEVRVKILRPGLPQYENNLFTINKLKDRFHEENPNIRLLGTWSGGISVLDGFKNVGQTLKDW